MGRLLSIEEVGRRADTGDVVVRNSLFPSSRSRDASWGIPAKAKEKLGWTPTTSRSSGFNVVGARSEFVVAIFGGRGSISRALARNGFNFQPSRQDLDLRRCQSMDAVSLM